MYKGKLVKLRAYKEDDIEKAVELTETLNL